jgi:hypothetical protein
MTQYSLCVPMYVMGPPVDDATIATCCDCAEPVWVDPHGKITDLFICVLCAWDRVQKDEEAIVMPGLGESEFGARKMLGIVANAVRLRYEKRPR